MQRLHIYSGIGMVSQENGLEQGSIGTIGSIGKKWTLTRRG